MAIGRQSQNLEVLAAPISKCCAWLAGGKDMTMFSDEALRDKLLQLILSDPPMRMIEIDDLSNVVWLPGLEVQPANFNAELRCCELARV